nr:class I SAM-dependent methyltransferase [uncultured Anaeromusa sp.]
MKKLQLETLRQEWKTEGDWKKTQEFWDLRAAEFAGKERDSSRMRSTLSYLEGKGLVCAGAAVLDIGCGPGAYALEFARRGASVVGTDISGNMLHYARNRAEEEGVLGKTEFVQAVWEAIDLKMQGWQGAFDLTFASMCPGISSVEALLALCRASRKACFLTTFARRRDIIREQLGRQFFGEAYQAPWGKTLSYTVATLFAAGYYPEVTYQQENWQWEMSLGDAVRTYAPFFKEVCSSEEELVSRLQASLLALAQDGKVEERSESLIARVYWRVDEK